jgi:hypothetical protein
MTLGIASACETRFMYINSLEYATLTANSGNLAGFPASNVVTKNRGNLWVTKGSFQIVSVTNDSIYISIGTNQYNLSLTPGNYTATTLAAHISARILAVSGVVITCSYTTDFKFRFFSSATAFTLKLSTQSQMIWGTIGFLGSVDIPVLISTNADGEIRAHTSEYLYYDIGYAMDIDFFALLPQRNTQNMLTAGAVINIKASNTNDISSAPLNVNVSPGDEATYYFLETGSAIAYRYVWITITDISNPNGPNLVFSQLFLGGYSSIDRTVGNGFSLQNVDRALRTESQAGGLYFERYGRHKSISNLSFSNITRLQKRELDQVFFDLGKSSNFYISLEGGNLNDDIYEYTDYVVFESDATITKGSANLFDASFNVRSN